MENYILHQKRAKKIDRKEGRVMVTFFQSNFITWMSPIVSEKVKPNPLIHDPCRPFHTLGFCFEGEQTIICEGKTLVGTKDTILYLPKGSECSFIRKQPSVYIHFSFDVKYSENINAFVKEYSNSSQFRDMFTSLYNAQSAGKPGCESQILSIVYKILSAIQSKESSVYVSSQHYKKISASLEYIDKNCLDNRITTPMLAEMSGMSLRYYNTLFNTFFGCSPKKYIMNKKIDEAKKMLLNTTLSIREISVRGGFSDEFYFCKVFKREVGMTPTEFRRLII